MFKLLHFNIHSIREFIFITRVQSELIDFQIDAERKTSDWLIIMIGLERRLVSIDLWTHFIQESLLIVGHFTANMYW